jgi:hypothetical protein
MNKTSTQNPGIIPEAPGCAATKSIQEATVTPKRSTTAGTVVKPFGCFV